MQDKIMKFLAYEGKISVVCTSTTELVEEARKIHDLSPVATAAFGRLLTISAIMGNEMKGAKDKLTVQMKGNGPLGTMLVTADNFPRVKGYVANPVVDLPLNDMGKLDVGGRLQCRKAPPGRGQSANTALRRRFRLSVGCSGSEIRRSIKLYIAAVVNWYAGVLCLSVNERSGRPESRSDRQSVSGGLAAEKALNFFRPFLASA